MAGVLQEDGDSSSYSQLLFGDDDDTSLLAAGCFNFMNSSPPPSMLCFADDSHVQKSGVTCCDNSPPACSSSNSKPTKSNKKRNGAEKESAPAANQRNSKRTKSDNSNVTTGGHAKVKKEKLGERIAALQQLVSPFGKTDTASVLHEAMGYIRFLQDQVQVLCSPYMQRLPPPLREGGESGEMETSRKEGVLRSKGLCVVPIELTMHVAHTGADLWSPAAMMNNPHLSSSNSSNP